MSAEIKLWHDCPACPNCSAAVGCPAAREERGRWYGPADSNLFCPACGTAWLGSPVEMAQALRAQDAWDRKLYVESGEQRLLDAVDRCLAVIGDPHMHNAGKGSAVAELGLFLRDGVKKARGER
jgi:hypothetical protein